MRYAKQIERERKIKKIIIIKQLINQLIGEKRMNQRIREENEGYSKNLPLTLALSRSWSLFNVLPINLNVWHVSNLGPFRPAFLDASFCQYGTPINFKSL